METVNTVVHRIWKGGKEMTTSLLIAVTALGMGAAPALASLWLQSAWPMLLYVPFILYTFYDVGGD